MKQAGEQTGLVREKCEVGGTVVDVGYTQSILHIRMKMALDNPI